ncbi:hypothetical protein ED388_04515 [Muribaculaceae bacterium Isolate-007 (NCI)]|nr:hypothetical protein ED388_04515 [Muribaculaceae bacterium Isolate-007 (NCI)]
METSITISTPDSRILPCDDNMTIDISIKGITVRDIHRFGDMRPIIAASLESHIEMAKLPEKETRDLKAEVKRLVYGEDA